MCKSARVVVFAGTTEGYGLSRFLSRGGVSVCACVATEYGGKSIQEGPCLSVRVGRQDTVQMTAMLEELQPELVVDATHPYAAEVTANIRTACQASGRECLRVLREAGKEAGGKASVVYVESTQAAVDYLEKTQGNILLATGSKELRAYRELTGFQERVFARVLSTPGVMDTCRELGLEGRHLIGMQGPFSRELNEAMLRQYECSYLVTKDTGAAGGFPEKLEAAEACGVTAVVIGRPLQEEGVSLREAKSLLAKRFSLKLAPRITLLGIGMGGRKTLTIEGAEAAERAELCIGARRMVDAVAGPEADRHYEYRSSEIAAYIRQNPIYEHVLVALSGDVGFYSGARKLLEELKSVAGEVEVLCGISSVSYFMSKIGLSWDDARIVSAHGRECALASLAARNEKVFAILGTEDGAGKLAAELTRMGLGEVTLYVGENLSYPQEKITSGKARELTELRCDPLSVVCTHHPGARRLTTTHGLPDEAFFRGKAPMTKEEVRTVSVSKLQLHEDSICYDVGAGTGSVSVEMALRCELGKVYAVEKKEEALEVLEENRRRFVLDNLIPVPGSAPEALTDLPAPTHVFIGGSSGNLRQIMKVCLEKNPKVRFVINCITLETVSEALLALKELDFTERQIVSLSVARSREVAAYHMMTGENPIYIITCQNPA